MDEEEGAFFSPDASPASSPRTLTERSMMFSGGIVGAMPKGPYPARGAHPREGYAEFPMAIWTGLWDLLDSQRRQIDCLEQAARLQTSGQSLPEDPGRVHGAHESRHSATSPERQGGPVIREGPRSLGEGRVRHTGDGDQLQWSLFCDPTEASLGELEVMFNLHQARPLDASRPVRSTAIAGHPDSECPWPCEEADATPGDVPPPPCHPSGHVARASSSTGACGGCGLGESAMKLSEEGAGSNGAGGTTGHAASGDAPDTVAPQFESEGPSPDGPCGQNGPDPAGAQGASHRSYTGYTARCLPARE